MTTATQTTDSNALTLEIDCHDEDGKPTVITVTLTADEDGGYRIEATEDGDVIDSDSTDSIIKAESIASEMVKQIKADDRTRERNRIRDQRQYRKEALLGTAEEMTGFDRKAVELLARLIGSGKGEAALAYLRDVK